MKIYNSFNEMFTANSNTSHSIFNFDGKEAFLDKCEEDLINEYKTIYDWWSEDHIEISSGAYAYLSEDDEFRQTYSGCIQDIIDEECASLDDCMRVLATFKKEALSYSDNKTILVDDISEIAKDILWDYFFENEEQIIQNVYKRFRS